MDKPETMCDRCRMAARCLLDYDGECCKKSREDFFGEELSPRNIDWLRSLSDEGFAEWCANLVCNAKNRTWLEAVVDTKEGWLSWLRKER